MLLAVDVKLLSALSWVFIAGIAVVVFMIGLSFSAFILKTACRTAGVEVPDTGKAMVVSLLESVAGGVSWICSAIIISFLGIATRMDHTAMAVMAGMGAITVCLFVPAGLYVPMLRVTFPKGILIAVLKYVIIIGIAAGLTFVLMVVTGGKHR
jgi:hypothetical protein